MSSRPATPERLLVDQRTNILEYLREGEKSSDPHNSKQLGRLPPDILYRIFLDCLPTNLAAKDLTTETPGNISQVCRSWRSLALDNPSLWAHFELHMPVLDVTPLNSHCAYDRVKRWIDLSKNALLSVSLEIKDTQHRKRIMHCLMDQEHRWKNIRIRTTSPSGPWSFPYIRCGPSLQRLDLHSLAVGSLGNDLCVSMDGPHPSNLRSIQVVGRFNLVANALDLPDLLELRYVPQNLQAGGRFLSLLRSAASVVHLDMSLNYMPTSDPQTTVVLPRLRHLELNCEGFRVDRAPFFFDNISFPSLSKLKLRACPVSGDVLTWRAIEGAYRRSKPPLQSACFVAVSGRLEGIGAHAWPDEYVQGFTSVLRAMHQLKQLEINDGLVTTLLLHELAAQVGSEAAICPKLESLALGCPWLPFLGECSIIGLVTSRWRLKSQWFKLSIRCNMTQPHVARILEADDVLDCVEKGLELVVT